ncbi:hypothetical protein EC844_12575 [Acinetobacter calcoaceticus]|uniref:Uncharacterized protein n=1 Tax=Acinetobacter calcoaceticus TaxID=471 RepID=A0A4R1XEQ0_ACICA|nr:hypothetical protein EC844_12575 [Acinetobacter calcoaceticus]
MDWWNKAMRKLILLVACCFSAACASQKVYVHPSLKGQFINQVTNELVSKKSYIASTIKERVW